ncbi:hypothetical protein PR002_g25961 [Phytophthora rubi]|uniref:Uncharacterized protein n=1 Tax=Phytophthora rubi TaxID=129364 RepID=A0A6A3HWA3_9STRA|nr:hypothetical protein PR002_g25961 [Phytophthora rubi]
MTSGPSANVQSGRSPLGSSFSVRFGVLLVSFWSTAQEASTVVNTGATGEGALFSLFFSSRPSTPGRDSLCDAHCVGGTSSSLACVLSSSCDAKSANDVCERVAAPIQTTCESPG